VGDIFVAGRAIFEVFGSQLVFHVACFNFGNCAVQECDTAVGKLSTVNKQARGNRGLTCLRGSRSEAERVGIGIVQGHKQRKGIIQRMRAELRKIEDPAAQLC
jgi:hypothetical protein